MQQCRNAGILHTTSPPYHHITTAPHHLSTCPLVRSPLRYPNILMCLQRESPIRVIFNVPDNLWEHLLPMTPFRLQKEMCPIVHSFGLFFRPFEVFIILNNYLQLMAKRIKFIAWRPVMFWREADPVPCTRKWLGSGSLEKSFYDLRITNSDFRIILVTRMHPHTP